MKLNTIIHGDALTKLKEFDDKCIDMCITSPPYWGLRDYGVDNQLGLEPTFEEYITKLCDIFDEVKRVLKNTGTCWVNLGDTYWGGGQGGNTWGKSKEIIDTNSYGHKAIGKEYQTKSLCCIPDRFKIEMINRGWILRNTLIWYKPNCMPSSAKDRFTVDFEYLFFFVKSSTTQYWIHTRKLLAVNQKPRADYRWQHATGYELKKQPKEKDWDKKRVVCPECKGTGKVPHIEDLPLFGLMELGKTKCQRCCPSTQNKDVENYTVEEWQKINLWEGKDYWFEQQFEEFSEDYINDKRPMGILRQKFYPESGYNKSQDNHLKQFQTKIPKENAESYGSPRARYNRDGYTDYHKEYQGRNKRCVWKITTQPFSEAHFAVFPEELIETPIKAGCPQYICKKCGVAREKIYDVEYEPIRKSKIQDQPKQQMRKNAKLPAEKPFGFTKYAVANAIHNFKGYTDCGCGAGFRPGVVLDPFIGSGTTGVVARKHGRDFIGIELNKEYIEMAHKEIMAIHESLFKEI